MVALKETDSKTSLLFLRYRFFSYCAEVEPDHAGDDITIRFRFSLATCSTRRLRFLLA